MISIFLSYSRGDDEAFVRRLYADLTKAGFDVWFDRISMPSRQLTFHQEIRDAIAARDRLLLVVGPAALASDYVAQEWRFAYFEAGRCVNPIVRLDGHGPDGSKVDGYQLIPEDLKLLHAEDFRDDALYDQHLQNLIRQLSEAVPPVGKLVAVPELPAHFFTQTDRIKALRDLLLVDLQKPVVVSGAAARVGLQGMGGIGKSVLASALAHRPEVRRAFPDGIYWITLGQNPNLAELQRWLARELGDEALFPDERSGKECLRKLLAGRKTALVLDDVWQREHAEAFNVIGPMGRILLTTRDAGLVTALASKETHYRVELPGEAEAETIFAAAAGLNPNELPPETKEIVVQCGRLPLALALCGGMVRGGDRPGVPAADVLEALREHDLEFLSTNQPSEEQHRNVWKAMDVSLRVLTPEERDRFAELAVFALDRGAPEPAVATLWEHTGGLRPRYAHKLLADLADRSLVQLSPAKEGSGQTGVTVTLHDLLHNFAEGMAEKRLGSLAALHQSLLDAYAKYCPDAWPSGPDDGYYFQNLCQHLIAAGKLDDVVALLTDIPWIEAKCRAKLAFSLQDDYRNTIAVLPEAQEGLKEERDRQARLARWTEDITEYSRQWSNRRDRTARGEAITEPEPRIPEPPATCRMWTDEEIETECNRIRETPTRLDKLSVFGGFVASELHALDRFGDLEGFVLQCAINSAPDGPVHEGALELLSHCGAPLLLQLWCENASWNPKPVILRTLNELNADVSNVCMTADGRLAVSGGWGKVLHIWDLNSGACLRTVDVKEFTVTCISMTPDGQLAVSGYLNKMVGLWDIEHGSLRCALEGHRETVTCVCLTPDGQRALSGSADKTLRLWNADSEACIHTLEGHSSYIICVEMTPDGRRAVSGCWDGTLRVWDLKSGACLWILEAHSAGVTSVSVTPDGRRAVSGSSDGMLRVWDLEGGTCVRTLEVSSDQPSNVRVTPDGQRAVLGSDDGTLRVWDLESGVCIRTLQALRGAFGSLCISGDGGRAISGGANETLRVWNLESGAGATSHDGHQLCVRSISTALGGRRVVSSGDDKKLRVWDVESGQCVRIVEEYSARVTSMSITPDGHRGVSGSQDRTLRVWDLETGECLHTLEVQNSSPICDGLIKSVTVTRGGQRVVWASDEEPLRVWEPERGTCIRTLEYCSNVQSCVNITPDGRQVLAASLDGSISVWDMEGGAVLRTLKGHQLDDLAIQYDIRREVCCLCVTPDGRRAVSGSKDKTIRVWDIESGCLLLTLEGHTGSVDCVSVMPNSLVAVSGSSDETLRMWDLQSGACLGVLTVIAPVTAVATSSSRLTFGTQIGGLFFAEIRKLPLESEITVGVGDTKYGALLRQGFENSLLQKGPGHEETVAHRTALAALLERMGRSDEARSL